MKKYTAVIVLGMMVLSCSPKKEKIIAIDVLLSLPEEMYSHAIHLNDLIYKNNPETIKLNDGHIPHITLLQCFVNEGDMPKINLALEGLYDNIRNENLLAESLFFYHDKEDSFSMITIKKNQKLLKLHEKAIELVKPFIVFDGSSKSFVQNLDGSSIGESTLTYVPEFVEKHSYENFDPHISLGVAQRVLLDSLAKNVFKQISFKASSISVYHLGDHGTAQKLLWKSE